MSKIKLLALILALTTLAGCVSSGKKPAASQENDPKYQYEKGLISLRYGLTDEAVRYANQAISLDPEFAMAYNLLGTAYFNKRNFPESVSAYGKAAELDPKSAEIQTNLGLACVEAGETDRAEAALRTSFGIEDAALTAYYLGRLLFNLKRYEEALEYTRISLQKDSNSADSYNLKGVILNQLGRYKEAAGSFQGGLVLKPDDVGLQVNLGIAYINSQEPEKARPVLEKVLPQIKDAILKARIEEYLKKSSR